MKLIKTFVRKEDGAVTVDWVVITAAIVTLCLALLATIRTAANNEAASWFS